MNENKHTQAVDTSAYYYQRIAELGLSESQAQRAGIWHDTKNGNVLLYARHFNGKHVNVTDQHTGRARNFTVRRIHPDKVGTTYWRLNKETGDREQAVIPKYLSEPGHTPRPYPTPAAIEAHLAGIQGGTLLFIEGYFKALALSLAGVESVAFGGLSLYKLDDAIKEYVSRRRPSQILIGYDGDAMEVRRNKDTGQLTSKRRDNFCSSAFLFAQQLFDYLKRIGHTATVRFVMVNPEQPYKGADDLLVGANDPAAVCSELLDGTTGNYWQGFTLKASSYEAQLKAFFKLDEPANFYRENSELIGNEPFTWSGYTFQNTEGGLVMPQDQFAVEVDTIPLQVDTYLGERADHIEELINTYPQLAIQAPTGTGKTTGIIKIAKVTGQRLLVVVPLKAIAGQQGSEDGVFVLHGSVSPEIAAAANAAPIVVCTYDTAHHITDVSERILAIDEAHDLVNQQGFRAAAISRFFELTRTAKRVVYLSGTMPKALLKLNNIPLVDIHRANSPKVRLHRLNAASSSKKAMAAALVSQLVGDLKTNDGKTHIALFNDKKQLELIRKSLIKAGILKKDEVQVLSRSHIEGGESSGYTDLVELQKIRPGVRLVLTTTIIAEGVTIKNTNIGRGYSVGVTCPDTVRQFAARCREMGVIDLFLITRPGDVPGWDFKDNTNNRIEYEIKRAEASAMLATIDKDKAQNDDFYKSEFYGCIKPTADGKGFEVDELAILAKEYARKINNAPPAYLIGRLLEYDGFELYTEALADNDVNAVAELDEVREAHKRQKEAYMATLREELTSDPSLPICALFHHYKSKGDRHGAKAIQHLAGDLLRFELDAAAIAWKAEKRALLEDKDVTELIRRAAQLHFAGVNDTAAPLKLKARTWKRTWKQTVTYYGLQVIEGKKARELPHLQRLDLKAKKEIASAINSRLFLDKSPFTSTEIITIIRNVLTFADRRTGIDQAVCLADITPRRAADLVAELFYTKSVGKRTVILGRIGEIQTESHFARTCTLFEANPAQIQGLKV